MNTLYRTTITLPEQTYRKTKIQAAYQNKSVSKFIRDILEKTVTTALKQESAPPIPFGKYSFKEKKGETYRRADLYDDYLKRKVPH